MTDSNFNDILGKIKKFRDDRDWSQFHNHKDMAISLVLEASEVLEHFQWKSKDEIKKHIEDYKEEISDELADVAMYLFELSDNLGINLFAAIESKLQKNEEKYPIKKSKGSNKKYTHL